MSHEITEFDTPIYAGQPAWHGLGTVLPKAPTPEEALKLAGLDWQLEQRPLFMKAAEELDSAGYPIMPAAPYVPVESHVANVRSDTGEVLAVVGKGYDPVQNADLCRFILEVATRNADLIEIESAGSLMGGRRVWYLARTPSLIELGNAENPDRVVPYVAFINGHDGQLSLWVKPTTVRVVCNNTLTAAIGDADGAEAAGRALSFQHRGDVMGRVGEARRAIVASLEGIERFRQEATKMAANEIGGQYDAHGVPLLLSLYAAIYQRHWATAPKAEPTPEVLKAAAEGSKEAKAEARRWTRMQVTIADWRQRFESAETATGLSTVGMGIAGTVWSALQGVTEYADHAKVVRNVDSGGRTYSSLFGDAEKLKGTAFEACRELVTAGEVREGEQAGG